MKRSAPAPNGPIAPCPMQKRTETISSLLRSSVGTRMSSTA